MFLWPSKERQKETIWAQSGPPNNSILNNGSLLGWGSCDHVTSGHGCMVASWRPTNQSNHLVQRLCKWGNLVSLFWNGWIRFTSIPPCKQLTGFVVSQGNICGLCGNYDGSIKNDFTSRNNEVVTKAFDFANTWKVPPNCPDAVLEKDGCDEHPHRKAWATKHCNIIKSKVFAACHSKARTPLSNLVEVCEVDLLAQKNNEFIISSIEKVDFDEYFQSCERDTCSCDSGGDCECFCSNVAAYAAACKVAGVCVKWRTPSICRKSPSLLPHQELNKKN